MRKLKNLKLIVMLIAALLLAGCDSESKRVVDLHLQYITADSAPVQSVDRNAQAQLANTASAVDGSLQTLSAIQLAKNPGVKIQQPLDANKIGMGQIASLDFTGPAESILKKLATASHYKLHILGTQPAIPVLVSLNIDNQTLEYMVRSVAYQIVNKARVKIYPSSKVIELRYFQP